MKKHCKLYYIVLTFIVLANFTASAQNILTNGGFESGGSGVGFKVDNPPSYTLATTPGTSIQGNYAFVSNPRDMNSSFISGGDHTTGTGKMMVVDGSTFGINYHFWNTGSTGGAIGGFVIGKSYVFSYWIKSVSNDVTNVATRANINLYTVDASSIIPPITSSLAPLPANGWQQVSYTFVANKTNVLIQLYNTNTGALGNDFAIDDVSITCISPPILTIQVPAIVCFPTKVNLTLPAVTAGSDLGTLTYYTDAAATPISQLSTLSASAIATNGTYYIKNTASLGCETVRPVVVTIAPPVASPDVITPINLCLTAPTALIATPLPGNTLKWYGTAATGGTASSTPTIPNATGAYYVSQTNGTCDSGRVQIQANLVADNGAKISTLFCSPGQLPVAERNSAVFFEWDNDPLAPNDIYSYSYTIQGSTTVTGTTTSSSLKVSGLLPGQSVTIVITSVKFPCKPTVTEKCTVPCPLPLLKPNFPLITQVYCVGNAIPNLSNTSPTTGIVGTWSPSNVISNAASGTYTFTPDPILHPCTETQTLTVTVNPIVAPTFLSLPTPTLNVCQNSTGQVLPTISNDAIPITGTWGPFTSINTTIIGTTPYTFIPTAGQCVSSTPTTINVTINSIETPTFNSIPAICAGTTLVPLLPANSTNFSPISGVWNPDKIDNTTTKEYEFTPIITSHPCAPKTKITVTVTQNVTPTFAVSDTQCEGTGIVTLPNTSTNTPIISGTWTDSTGTIISTINTSIVAVNPLFFTPNLGSCVISPTTPKTITVYSNAATTFNPILDFCAGSPIPLLPPNSIEGIPGTWNPSAISGSVGTKNYQFTPNISCSPTPPPLAVTVLDSPIPTFLPIVPTDVCEGATFVLPDTSNDTPPITGSWETLSGPVTSIDTSVAGTDNYTFILDAGQCATAPAAIEITVNPSNTLTGVSWTVTDAFEDNQIITVVATAPGNYLYQLDSGPLQTSPIFENVSAGIHSVTVSDANGCSTSITENNVLVIKHPKYFTPNGDGFNDTWKISGSTNILITNIYIFDRYGKLLKEIAANGNGWDGTYLGVPLPTDDYWFTVDYVEDFSPKEFKAHFSLKR